jgi:hypothetical protein
MKLARLIKNNNSPDISNDSGWKSNPSSGVYVKHFWPTFTTFSAITYALMLYATLRMPGSIEACSSVPNDVCIFPPNFIIVYPSIIAMALGIILVAVDRGCRAAGLLALLLSAALRLLDAYIALVPNAMGNDADQYDWYHDVMINRPTSGGWIAFAGSLALVVFATVGIIQFVRTSGRWTKFLSKMPWR